MSSQASGGVGLRDHDPSPEEIQEERRQLNAAARTLQREEDRRRQEAQQDDEVAEARRVVERAEAQKRLDDERARVRAAGERDMLGRPIRYGRTARPGDVIEPASLTYVVDPSASDPGPVFALMLVRWRTEHLIRWVSGVRHAPAYWYTRTVGGLGSLLFPRGGGSVSSPLIGSQLVDMSGPDDRARWFREGGDVGVETVRGWFRPEPATAGAVALVVSNPAEVDPWAALLGPYPETGVGGWRWSPELPDGPTVMVMTHRRDLPADARSLQVVAPDRATFVDRPPSVVVLDEHVGDTATGRAWLVDWSSPRVEIREAQR